VISSLARQTNLEGLAIDRLISQLMRALKAFANLVRRTSLAYVHEKIARISFLPATPSKV
jgi:hypothetical protein